MNILFANARPPYPFIVGGDGMNIHTYFSWLTARGHACSWLGTTRPEEGYWMPGPVPASVMLLHNRILPAVSFSRETRSLAVSWRCPYRSVMVRPSLFAAEFEREMQIRKPDVVITQLGGAETVLHAVRAAHIPVVFFLTDSEPQSIGRVMDHDNGMPSAIVCVSSFVRSKLPADMPVPVRVLVPPVNPDDYTVTSRPDGFVTCVNPVRQKGGAVFRQIVERMPDVRFLAVKGWYDPKLDGLDFSAYPNIRIMDKQTDMRHVYTRTRLLLVPSLWDEAIPRVVTEAGLSGIPSIASDRGGIGEAVGAGGILVANGENANEWVGAIRGILSDPSRYEMLSLAAITRTKRFTVARVGPQFERLLLQLAHKR